MSASMDLSPLEHPLTADSRLFFLHIPKTGGITFDAILKQHFDEKDCAPFYFSRHLPELPKHYFTAYRYYHTHFCYDFIPKLLPEGTIWLTFLREPVERFLSSFAYSQRILFSFPVDNVSWFGSFASLYQLEVTDFVNHPHMPPVMINLQTWMLGARFNFKDYLDLTAILSQLPTWDYETFASLAIKDSPEDLLTRAKQRLAEAAFFGLTERYQDALYLLAYTFGWPPQTDKLRLNVAVARPRQADLPAETLVRIVEANRLDLELYAGAQRLFEARFAQMSLELLEHYGGRAHAHLKLPLPTDVLADLLGKRYARRLADRQTLPCSFSFNSDQAIRSEGWYPIEQHPQHGSFRWSGPDRRATFDLLLRPDNAARIIFSVMAAITPETLDNLCLQVNGQPVVLNRYPGREGAIVFVGYIPQATLTEGMGFTRLTFEIDPTISPAALTGSDDNRLLGLALNQLEIYPLIADAPGWAESCRRLIAPEVLAHLPHLFRSTDIIVPGRGWYPLESYLGGTFYLKIY